MIPGDLHMPEHPQLAKSRTDSLHTGREEAWLEHFFISCSFSPLLFFLLSKNVSWLLLLFTIFLLVFPVLLKHFHLCRVVVSEHFTEPSFFHGRFLSWLTTYRRPYFNKEREHNGGFWDFQAACNARISIVCILKCTQKRGAKSSLPVCAFSALCSQCISTRMWGTHHVVCSIFLPSPSDQLCHPLSPSNEAISTVTLVEANVISLSYQSSFTIGLSADTLVSLRFTIYLIIRAVF